MAGLFTPNSRPNGAIPNVKLTPSSSSPSQTFRTPQKSQNRRSSPGTDRNISLQRVIGCSTTAFDAHPPSRSFAYTAGAAAVVTSLDDELNISQRFFRARPNALTLTSAAAGAGYTPSTPQTTAQENRTRAAASLREAGIGYSPGHTYSEDSGLGSKTWTARERIKAATCLSFSPDGKWLAVGETGYNPRVLIFSMSKEVPSDVPVAAMAEHTFGVRDVAFSPDSKYLASIGTANDGFIYVWSLNPGRPGLVQLYASNKCTSFIRQITWMGRCLVTVGTRHVKLWKTDDDKAVGPGPRVLSGRNALLGNMSDSTMSCVVGISEDKALVCSERGDICLLEEREMRFSKVADAGFKVNCITIDPEKKFAWVAGKNGRHSTLVLKDIVLPTPPVSPSSSRSNSPILPEGSKKADVAAMASMLGHLFILDSNRSLKIINMTTVEGVPVPNSVIREFPAHKNAVLGVRLLPKGNAFSADFFTWAADGVVMFWNMDGRCLKEFQVEVEQPADLEDEAANELKVVRVSKNGDYFVAGDKYGVLRIINGETRECIYDVKAHSGEIMDIVIHKHIIVSCARDRTVQVFSSISGSWNLTQTLDDHTASVSRVLFLEDGSKLLSCSTDRTIVVRELHKREGLDKTIIEAFVPIRTLSTKASPVHMTSFSDTSTTLLVSTLDRQIIKFDMVSGKTLSSFKVTDESGDAVVMDAITLTEDRGPSKPRIIVGTSTTDKSIRIYDLNGGLIDKEWGHTEGVSDVALLGSGDDDGNHMKLVSTGTDGTIMIWEFMSRDAVGQPQEGAKESPLLDSPIPQRELTATKAPIRRVLSRSELMDFTSPSTKASPTPDPTRISSGSQSVGSSSPPRPVRKKTSTLSLNRYSRGAPSPLPPLPGPADRSQLTIQPATTTSDGSTSPSTPLFPPTATPSGATTPNPTTDGGRTSRKSAIRDRTPSPSETSTTRGTQQPHRRSSADTRTRRKSDGSSNGGINNVNGLAESLVRSLRSFRGKMERVSAADGHVSASEASSAGVKSEVLRELQRELGLTMKELGGCGSIENRSHHRLRSEKSASTLPTVPAGAVPDLVGGGVVGGLFGVGATGAGGLGKATGGGCAAGICGENAVISAMLEQYSAKLLSMVNERLEEQMAKAESVESWATAGRGAEKEGEG